MQSRRLSKRSVPNMSEGTPCEDAPGSEMRPVAVDRGKSHREGEHKEHGRPTCHGERDLKWPCKGVCANSAMEPKAGHYCTPNLQMAAQMRKDLESENSRRGFEHDSEMKQDYRRSIYLLEEKRKVVSSNIDVPQARREFGDISWIYQRLVLHMERKCEDEVDMDKVTAAMVLTSLSTSPVVLSPPARLTDNNNGSWKEVGFIASSTSSSDYWSWGTPSDYSYPSTPSPPQSVDSVKHFRSPLHQDDTVEDSETSGFLFDDPIPRKRKNSMKVLFTCLWKTCGKVLSTAAGIKKHIRTIHLGRSGESEDNDGEEDFYYTEVKMNMDPFDGASNMSPVSPLVSPSSRSLSSDTGCYDTFCAKAESKINSSTPSPFYLLTSERGAYQTSSPVNIPGSKKLHLNINSFNASSGSSTCCNSAEDHRQYEQTVISSPTRAGMGMSARKPRGENKKCRKVYGMENRDKWCTACRWKKACQRFLD
ncbi:zinc finger protein 704 isoform X1 [Pelobates fuscus]|uniref:zinc finger protein 704 isoform X1 n=1 Tax=Pelobates fuscus TaxID=191477 RepID=UPI002FE4E77F